MNEPKKREFRREVHRLLRTEGKRFAFGETQGMGGAGARGEVSLHKIFYKLCEKRMLFLAAEMRVVESDNLLCPSRSPWGDKAQLP